MQANYSEVQLLKNRETRRNKTKMALKYKNKSFVLKSLCVLVAMFLLRTLIIAFWKSDSTDNFNHELFSQDSRVRNFISCNNKDTDLKVFQSGIYWMLRNYVKATRYFKCDESITYTANADYSFLDNLVPLLKRWQGPVSIAVWAPGNLFGITLDSIAYLRNCHENSELVRNFTSFHIFFERQYFPKSISTTFDEFEQTYKCPTEEPFANASAVKEFKATFNATFPINVARNFARESALTHFVLASDFELYPSPGLIDQFFAMVAKDPKPYLEKKNVFVIPAFEVESDQQIPQTASELSVMIQNKTSIWMHSIACLRCPQIPNKEKWLLDINDKEMSVFQSVKRQGKQIYWEPFYIGTNDDPLFDERLDWEGKADKMSQAYIMCLLDYNYNVLSNAFLCHKQGIKTDAWRKKNVDLKYVKTKTDLLQTEIAKDLKIIYGDRKGCEVLKIIGGDFLVPGDFPSHLISIKEEKPKVV